MEGGGAGSDGKVTREDAVLTRIRKLADHAQPPAIRRAPTAGESGHLVDEAAAASGGVSKEERRAARAVLRFRYDRRPLKIAYTEAGGGGVEDTYGGKSGLVLLEGEILVPNATSDAVKSTVLLVMHPTGVMNMLPMPIALARAGAHVATCGSRYPHNDTCLVFEKVVRDMAAVVWHLKHKMKYERVVLAGWSGGGSLSAYYQKLAEAGTKGFSPCDALLLMAAHASRARILTEWLDPSIYLLHRGQYPDQEAKLREFDLYSKTGTAPSPPYNKEWLKRFREAQIARNRRITAWARDMLAKQREHLGTGGVPESSDGFVVDGTMADPRWLDLTLEANDRPRANWCFLGEPAKANMAPTGVARFSTYRSWISQWSYDDSPADGVACVRSVRCPTLVLENSADDAVPRSHLRDMFDASAAADKTYILIEGANHYFDGQKTKIAEACSRVIEWLNKKRLVDIELPGVARAVDHSAATAAASVLDVDELRCRYGEARPDRFELSGINHLAIMCSDMERTTAFYGGVLGFRLLKTLDLPRGGQHFFFDSGAPDQALAFFWFPDSRPPVPGVATVNWEEFANEGKITTAAGAMNHVAFNVPESRLVEYQGRLTASPLAQWVSPLIYHADNPFGLAVDREDPTVSWVSLYCAGPDGELLEFTAQVRDFATRGEEVAHLPQRGLWRNKTPHKR